MACDVPGFTNNRILGFIADAVMWRRPTHSLEIGTFMGRSASVICHALNQLGGNRTLTCVDFYVQVYNAEYLERSFMQYMINRCGPEIRDLYTDFGQLNTLEDCFWLTYERHPDMQRHARLIRANSQTLDLSNHEKIEFAYIDGDHSYEGVRCDFLLAASIMTPDALVVLDDFSVDFPGVQRFVNEIRNHSAMRYEGEQDGDIAFTVRDPGEVASYLADIMDSQRDVTAR